VAAFFNLTLQILPLQKQKSRAIAGAAFVNRDQVLGGAAPVELQICEYTTEISRLSKVLIRWR